MGRRAKSLARFILAMVVPLTACTQSPPDAEETVILVHGLGRTPASMSILRARLAGAGYRVVSFGYPSRSEPMEVLVQQLQAEVGECCAEGTGPFHFVTHSMGGVLVRAYLAERPEPFVGRVVMLSPPNQGSEVVDSFADSPLLRAILGPSGARLGTDSAGIAAELGAIDFSLGIITGDRSLNPIGSWLIPGPDDGKVGVEQARIEGAADFLVLPATHTFIMNRRDVAEEVVHFLREGEFQSGGAVSDEAQWDEGEAWTVPAEPRQTIGVLDGADEYQFVGVSAAARQSDGDLVVADLGSGTVRLYDRSGVHLETLGGQGSGPGDFRRPTQILVHAGDSIFVWDDAAFRTTKFGPDGELAGVQGADLAEIARSVEPPHYPASMVLLPGGDLLVRLVEKSGKSPPTGMARGQSGALRVSGDLSAIDTVMLFGDVEQVTVDAPWGPFAVVPPFARTTTIAVQPNQARACIGEQAGPEVVCFRPDGSRTEVRWLPEPKSVRADDAEVEAWREAAAELYGQKVSPDDVRRLLDQVPIPEVRPEYSEIHLDHGGHLWVKLGPTDRGGEMEYLVFDQAGALLGSVSMPPVRILEIGPDYVVAVHRDEFEVEYVQIFDITKPSTAARAN